MSGREMREELREAKINRSAAVGLVVFTPAHAPTGIAPFDRLVTQVMTQSPYREARRVFSSNML